MTIVDKLPPFLRGSRIGRELLTEAERAEARLAERRAARAKLEQAETEEAALPKLADAVALARTKYHTEVDRLAEKLHAAIVAHDQVARRSSHLRARGESILRRTAPPLVAENGALVPALWSAIEHMRRHLLGVGDDHWMTRALATSEPETPAPEDVEPVEKAKARVKGADDAAAAIEVFSFALAELRDLQLEVEVTPGAVREVVEGLPAVCSCGFQFNIEAAFTKATEAEEVA